MIAPDVETELINELAREIADVTLTEEIDDECETMLDVS